MTKVTENLLINEIKRIIADIAECEPKDIALDANFYKDLGIDSIKAIEIAVSIERKFAISIRDKQIVEIATVKQAVDLVKRLLTRKKK